MMTKESSGVSFLCDGDIVTAHIRGEIDHHSAALVRRTLDEQICRSHPKILRLDTSDVTFMDSSGLGLLMGRLALLQKCGGELILCQPSPGVLRIVRLAGLERLLKIEQ